MQEEAKINRLRLELFSQPTSHPEKDKLALVSYDHDGNFTASYENYAQSKAKDTMPACNSNAGQKMVSPISHHVLNQRFEALKPDALMRRSASAPSFIDVNEYWASVRKMQ